MRRTFVAIAAQTRMLQAAHGTWSGVGQALPWSASSAKSQKKLRENADLTAKLQGAYGNAGVVAPAGGAHKKGVV